MQNGRETKKEGVCLSTNTFMESGGVLLSRAVSSQVPSALRGLTSVFGMGTGGSLSPLSPEIEFFLSCLTYLAFAFLPDTATHLYNCTVRVDPNAFTSFAFKVSSDSSVLPGLLRFRSAFRPAPQLSDQALDLLVSSS